ncbi:protein kinase domain containing protein [Stylonychia lemnae]|uniref:Casein kinase I n=1 Tax=Stylonychia lemnae TaxID=5949 RepID=A0A078AU95_STYLE|nr:protein kinase domain containing protein [Stylonychia lemnae]|eukprot:CDW84408.1 protein kinase domain containing protein [Stylonychia lemnae]
MDDQSASGQIVDYIDAEKKIPKYLNSRYELREEIGRGAHGRIYSGKDKITKQLIAVKIMDKISKNKSKYVREIQLMKDMQKSNQPGFPKLLYYNADKYNYFIVMDQLGQSLKELRDNTEDLKFSIKTVTMIGIQLLQRLESIHKLNYVHRDLKPANILTGKSKLEQFIIYLIDFGLAKKQNQISNIQPNENGNKVVGTAIYAGINAHLPGQNYFKKDDIESMMYVLCYLLSGTLPWKNCKATDAGLDKMLKMKLKIQPYDLFAGQPTEFCQIMEHLRNQPSEQIIDYGYIDSLLRSVAYKSKFKIDNVFDWITLKKTKIEEQKSDNKNKRNDQVHIGQVRNQNQDQGGIGLQTILEKYEDEEEKKVKNEESLKQMTNNYYNDESQVESFNMTINKHYQNTQQNQNLYQEQQPQNQQDVDRSANEQQPITIQQQQQQQQVQKQNRERKKRSKHHRSNILSGANNAIANNQKIENKDGKIGINLTLNIQSQKREQQEEQVNNNGSGKIVQMTINHNVHVHINGQDPDSANVQQSIHIVHPVENEEMKQTQQLFSFDKINSNILYSSGINHQNKNLQSNVLHHDDNEIRQSESRSDEDECDSSKKEQKEIANALNNEGFNSIDATYEEFEKGINLEFKEENQAQDCCNVVVDDQLLQQHQSFDFPKLFDTHSNFNKMKCLQ